MSVSFYAKPSLLLQALDRCSGIIRETSKPFTSFVLFEVNQDVLHLTASDAIVTVHNSIPVHGVTGENQSFCIKYSTFKNWLSNSFIASESVSLSFNGSKLHAFIKKGREAKFASLEADRFLSIHPLRSGDIITSVDGKLFKEATTSVASLADPEKYTSLRNTLVTFRESLFETIATDGFIFGYHCGMQKGEAEDKILVDSRALLSIVGAIRDFDTVFIHKRESPSKDIIFFSSQDCYVYTQTRKEDYPDVQQFLEEDHKNKALINKDSLARALQASRGFTKDSEKRPAIIEFNPLEENVKVSAQETELGVNSDVIGVDRIVGEHVEFKANIDYMLTAIERINGLKLELHFEEDEKGKPKFIHITDLEGKQKFVIAPML